MNTQIERLFAQALDLAVPETWTTLKPEQLARFKDKFAELIVRECAHIAWLNSTEDNISHTIIKQHFGVEE